MISLRLPFQESFNRSARVEVRHYSIQANKLDIGKNMEVRYAIILKRDLQKAEDKKEAGRNCSSRLLHSPHISCNYECIKPALLARRVLLPAFSPITLSIFSQALTPATCLPQNTACAAASLQDLCPHAYPFADIPLILLLHIPLACDLVQYGHTCHDVNRQNVYNTGLHASSLPDCARSEISFPHSHLPSGQYTIPCHHDERMNRKAVK